MADNAIVRPPPPRNEPPLSFAPGAPERTALAETLERLSRMPAEVPALIDGRDVREGEAAGEQRVPHRHAQVAARFPLLAPGDIERAIDGALRAHAEWSRTPWEDRAAIFLRTADILAGRRRIAADAATILGQSKTVYQAEIDAVCELADFWRFQAQLLSRMFQEQPESAPGEWNRLDYRPLEGFVLAVSPFNFTSIGGNLASAPLLLGNVVLWKPASDAVLSARLVVDILVEAGLLSVP